MEISIIVIAHKLLVRRVVSGKEGKSMKEKTWDPARQHLRLTICLKTDHLTKIHRN